MVQVVGVDGVGAGAVHQCARAEAVHAVQLAAEVAGAAYHAADRAAASEQLRVRRAGDTDGQSEDQLFSEGDVFHDVLLYLPQTICSACKENAWARRFHPSA